MAENVKVLVEGIIAHAIWSVMVIKILWLIIMFGYGPFFFFLKIRKLNFTVRSISSETVV